MKELPQDQISRQKKFDECLIEAVDEALTLLGDPVKNTIFLLLENRFNISKNEIPAHIKEFSDFLNLTFGIGAAHLEIKCMQYLHSKINVNIQETKDDWGLAKLLTDGLTFEGYVCNARDNYCNI